MYQAEQFADARQQIESGEAKVAGIEAMLELALGAGSSIIRQWAKTYLRERFDVTVTETDNETTSATGRISR